MQSYKTETGNPNESAARDDAKAAQDEKNKKKARENKGFVQMYPRGFRRIRDFAANPKTANAARLYALIAENIDSSTGAVIATQALLGKILGVSVKTVQRHSEILESEKALFRFQLQGGVYVYALNPEEVWAGRNEDKPHGAFYTGTLFSKHGMNVQYIRKKLNMLVDLADVAEQKVKKMKGNRRKPESLIQNQGTTMPGS